MDAPWAVDSRRHGLADYANLPGPDLFEKARRFASFLSDVRARGHETYLRPIVEYRGGSALIDCGPDLPPRRVLIMCSADYLGLARHPGLVQAASDALDRFGGSVSSVPLIAGSTALHAQLQRRLAAFLGTEVAVLFPTGHAANLGTLQALCGPDDFAVVDEQVHCSVHDGIHLAGAHKAAFRHSDPGALERALGVARRQAPESGLLVVVEGVYGVDGDIAPLPEILEATRRHGARLMVDDAHATGVLGSRGAGTFEHFGLAPGDAVLMGSLSKALGGMGGWVATSAAVADYLRYYARPFMFSVGMPAASAAAGLAALEVVRTDGACRRQLLENAEFFRRGLEGLGLAGPSRSATAIVSVRVGDQGVLRDLLREMLEAGLWAEGLPFPAVPRGEERIRFRISALHTRAELEEALRVVVGAWRSVRCGRPATEGKLRDPA